jgi:hypothetical protein
MASTKGRGLGIDPTRSATGPRRKYWRALVEECQRSGLSQAEVCRRRGIPLGTLGYWKFILGREGTRGRSSVRSGPEPPVFRVLSAGLRELT